MQDGRKWKAIPIVIPLYVGTFVASDEHNVLASSENVFFVEPKDESEPFRTIRRAVRQYRRKVLDEFSNLGFLVSYDHGRYRIGPALRPKSNMEGLFYYGPSDQRTGGRKYYTVDRDLCGIQHEVELFEALINRSETGEPELQRFLEDNPHFLGDIRMSLPLSQVHLESHSGKLLVPDFIVKPIVAIQRDSNWQVLDLKKPSAKLLAGPTRHTRLSHEVMQAICQLRNYGDYFRNHENTQRVEQLLGHCLKYPRLAVLIGRLHGCDVEALEKAQSREPDVRIVTYDEILERQQRLLT